MIPNFPPAINEPFTLNQVIDEDETPTQWNPVTITANDPDANSNSGTLVWTIEDDDTNGSVSLFFDGSNVIVDYMPEGNFSELTFSPSKFLKKTILNQVTRFCSALRLTRLKRSSIQKFSFIHSSCRRVFLGI